MINREEILLREKENDGRSVFLYYDEMAGLYLAFGLSAYYATMVTEAHMSYSIEMQMPVALLSRGPILYLRQSLKKLEHEAKKYYHFEMKTTVGEEGYAKWAQRIKEKHERL